MHCAYCKSQIDDDSFYCDQCGKEVLICPECKKTGKGKVCIYDGTLLVLAKNFVNENKSLIQNKFSYKETKEGVKPERENFLWGEQKSEILSKKNIPEIHLVNKILNIDLRITKEVVLGRQGDFADIFKDFEHVSRRHLKIFFEKDKGWVAIDLGSTNGTKYNHIKLQPHQPQILENNSYLKIANVEFFVKISEEDENRTVRS